LAGQVHFQAILAWKPGLYWAKNGRTQLMNYRAYLEQFSKYQDTQKSIKNEQKSLKVNNNAISSLFAALHLPSMSK
jgi:hypothetical protein